MAVGGKEASQLHKLLGDEMACPVCFEVFEEPKFLPKCAHSICRECLEEIYVRNKPRRYVDCPVCRARSFASNGIDAFPTNTLLVRLIENTPGYEEKKAIKTALKGAKEALENALETQDLLSSRSSGLESVRKQAADLKHEITKHSEKLVQNVKEQELVLHTEVDKQFREMYNAECNSYAENCKIRLTDFCQKSKNYIKTIEKTLSTGNIDEVIEMKTVFVKQLEELSAAPEVVIPSTVEPRNPAPFNVMFSKGNVEIELGELNLGNEAAATGLQGLKQANTATSQQPSISQQQSTPQASGSQPRAQDYRRGHLVHRFHPNESYVRRVSVCRTTGDIATLDHSDVVNIYSNTNGHLDGCYRSFDFKVKAHDIAFSRESELIVLSDEHVSSLYFYDKSGNSVHELHDSIDDVEEFTYLSVDISGRLIVTATVTNSDDDSSDDDDHNCTGSTILVYGPNYEYRFRFGKQWLLENCGRAEFYKNKFYVPDYLKDSIMIFHGNGNHLSEVSMTNIHSLVIDPINSNMLVCQQENAVKVYDVATNEYVMEIPTKTRKATCVALTKDCNNVVICFGNRKFFDVLSYDN